MGCEVSPSRLFRPVGACLRELKVIAVFRHSNYELMREEREKQKIDDGKIKTHSVPDPAKSRVGRVPVSEARCSKRFSRMGHTHPTAKKRLRLRQTKAPPRDRRTVWPHCWPSRKCRIQACNLCPLTSGRTRSARGSAFHRPGRPNRPRTSFFGLASRKTCRSANIAVQPISVWKERVPKGTNS